jgi:hypothetical protein
MAQPISRDEISEVGETLDERVFREKRNSHRRDRRQAQEQAEQEARQRRENPLFRRNLNPDFARAMNKLSEVGGVFARIADGLPQTPDVEGYQWLLTRAANHLLPLAHPPSDLRHAINSRRDARSSINASNERRQENEIRRREEYVRDHDIPARSQATRVESATASTGGTTWGRSRQHIGNSPPWDRHHNRRQEDTCGVSALTPRLRAIQWPPNFKVSNIDKYEPKQDPGGWLVVYTTAARAVGATEDVMTACPSSSGKMRCNRYNTYPDTASTIGATSVGIYSPTSNLSLTSRHSHGTSNRSGAEGMRLFGRTSKDFKP